jgi:hypothetical protein
MKFIFRKKIPSILHFNPVWSGYNLHTIYRSFAACTVCCNFVLEGADKRHNKAFQDTYNTICNSFDLSAGFDFKFN